MKTTLELPPPHHSSLPYPKAMISLDGSIIVLFHKKQQGTVIWVDKTALFYQIGYYNESWVEHEFKDVTPNTKLTLEF